MRDQILTPGSSEARKVGCTCPVLPNNFGRGYAGGPSPFVIDRHCPLHAKPAEPAQPKRAA